jgi:hypothetical protein
MKTARLLRSVVVVSCALLLAVYDAILFILVRPVGIPGYRRFLCSQDI